MELCCLHLGKLLFNRKNRDGGGPEWKFLSGGALDLLSVFLLSCFLNGVLTGPVLLVCALAINACVHSQPSLNYAEDQKKKISYASFMEKALTSIL